VGEVLAGVRVEGRPVWTDLDELDPRALLAADPWREQRRVGGQHLAFTSLMPGTTGRSCMIDEYSLQQRVMLADFDPTVLAIIGQPLQLKAATGRRTHVPELLLVGTGSQLTFVDPLLDERPRRALNGRPTCSTHGDGTTSSTVRSTRTSA